MSKPKDATVDTSDYWACACVKRNNRSGQMTHIKLHHPSVKSCRVCKCKPPEKSNA